MRAEANQELERLLAGLSPLHRPGEYVFVMADEAAPVADMSIFASVVEPEGRCLILTRSDAERAGLAFDFVAGWITLGVRSALDAVGLTATVATTLGEAGISCNVVAGYHHDPLLVPYERVGETVAVLHELSAHHRSVLRAQTIVRRAGVEDAPAVADLARGAYAPYVVSIGHEPAPMTDDYPRVIQEKEVWVAEQAGSLVGLLVLRAERPASRSAERSSRGHDVGRLRPEDRSEPRIDSPDMETVYEAAGGDVGLLRLAQVWHARVMADGVVSHAFSQGFHPEHSERLAAYWAEALGGPASYSSAYGDETTVVRMHSGNGAHEEMDRRAIVCFDQALTDVGLADDRVRPVLLDYFTWATTTTMSAYHRSADDVPAGLEIPHWSWDGLVSR